MNSYFTTDFFVNNRARLRQLFTGTAPILIAANGIMQRSGDSGYGFSQDANFWYLTGIDEPDLVLVMDKDREYLIVPPRDTSRTAFDGAIDDQGLTRRSGIATILEETEGWKQFDGRLKKVKHVATIAAPPAYLDRYGMYVNPARARLTERIKAGNPDIELLDLGLHLVHMRMIKQPPELAALQAAIDITIDTLKVVSRPTQLAKYSHEYELEADITRGFRKRGASGHSFEPIVASGARACTLHNIANNGPLAADELVVMDVGAEIEHYAADITRTKALGVPSRRQQAVHAAVLDVQQYAFGLLKPGVIIHDYELQIEQYMGEKLRELGLIKTIDHDSVRQYYPHSISHHLGLNVHDAADYAEPLQVGCVITVEPGIYIPEEGVGIRIEDDVLITEDGIQILTDRLPRDLA